MSGEIFKLVSLGVGDICGILEVVIDKLLVANISKWPKIDQGDGDERQSPERREFDQPIRDQGSHKGSNSMGGLLCEENALEFDYEEVDELLNIFQ